MRAKEFTIEAKLGTQPKRAPRPGSRPNRGHEPVGRYTTAKEEQFCEECGGTIWGSIAEHGKASRELCKSSKPDNELGASMLASCKSQGLRARDGEKSHKLGKSPKSRVKVGGHKIKGRKYGGPLPDWS